MKICAMLGVALLIGATGAEAQDPVELTGVLKRIKATRAVRIGYRTDAVPFSFTGRDGRPHGYSIDLCDAIVERIAAAVGGVSLRTEYQRVTPADRLDQVAEGRVELECGSTTRTAGRAKRVAFSPVLFITGTRLLVKRASPVRSARDLAGRTVLVVRGTTNEEVMRALAPRSGFKLEAAEGYAQALERLAAGGADALAADEILIAGHLAEKGLRREYAAVGDLLSFEQYGIAFARGDAPLAEVVQETFRELASSGEIRAIYNKWFLKTLPSGYRLRVPMSERLERSFQVLGLPAE